MTPGVSKMNILAFGENWKVRSKEPEEPISKMTLTVFFTSDALTSFQMLFLNVLVVYFRKIHKNLIKGSQF